MRKARTAPAAKPPGAATAPSRTLRMEAQPDKSEAQLIAELATGGLASNGVAMTHFSPGTLSTLPLTELVLALKDSGKAINANDFANAEQVLNAQALTLNLMFAELARRAALNMGEYLGAAETYMRLALRAQSQSRATFETLAAIKNPPLVFAKQMNVANGPQQVNNGTAPAGGPSPAQQKQTAPNELLEGDRDAGTLLDPGATTGAIRAHQDLATVGAIHRPAQR